MSNERTVELDDETLTARVDDAARRARQDPHGARSDLDGIIGLAEDRGFVATSARARYALARIHVSLGDADGALDLIGLAELGWRSIGEVDEAIRTNLGRMHVLDDLGRHAEAVSVGRQMLVELQGRGDDDELTWLRAAAQENVGVALGCVGRHEEALAAYELASRCYDELGLTDDAARALANRGVELNELARPHEAIPALLEALERFADADDRLWQALCLTNLSEAWIATGFYLEAFRCLDAARSHLDGLDQTTEWMRAELARARCLESLHLDVEALDLYEGLVEPLSSAGLLDELGTAHLGRGTIAARTPTLRADARIAFRAAFDAFESTGNGPMLARAYLAAAPLETEPSTLIDRAIALLADGERPAELAAAHLAAARHFEPIDVELAEAALRSAARLIDPLDLPSLRWQLHHRTGRLRRLTGAIGDARNEFESAIGVIDAIRSSLHRDGIRQRFDGAFGEPADDLVELLLDIGDEAGAFALGDSIRSRGLVERLADGARLIVEPHPDELLATYDRLLTATGPLAAELSARARRLEHDWAHETGVGGRTPVSRAGAPPQCVLYHTVGASITAFVTSGDDVVVIRDMADLREVEQLLRRLDGLWRSCAQPAIMARHADRLESTTIDVLRRLDDLLIRPVRGHLSASQPLVVVPDRSLGAVPFAALHDGDGFLVEHRAVRQTPSVEIDGILAARSYARGSVLALGTTDAMAPLAAKEAERVGAAWDEAAVFTADDSSASHLFDHAHAYDVIHVSGHGLFRPDAPEFSAIRLADRWVTAAEITRLELNGQLVVLSACDTGRRTVDGPRDSLGLPRAFIAAGAAGVVVSLWAAHDDATTELMTGLHRSLAAGQSPATALRTAQLATMSLHRHPFFWGGATLIGGPDPEAQRNSTTRRT